MIPYCSTPARTLAAMFVLTAAAAILISPCEARAQAAGDPPATAPRLYLDSTTGAVTATPSADGVELSPREVEMLSTSSEGLPVRRSASGGQSVHLGGRFRYMATATVSPDGEVTLGCAGPQPGAAPQPAEPRP